MKNAEKLKKIVDDLEEISWRLGDNGAREKAAEMIVGLDHAIRQHVLLIENVCAHIAVMEPRSSTLGDAYRSKGRAEVKMELAKIISENLSIKPEEK